MFKTFILGLILGLLAAGGLVYVAPTVNLERERSIMTVNPNGGVQERFYANLPGDRIMASVDSGEKTFPAELLWPNYLDIGDAQAELFKLRNDNDRVVGVASRIKTGGADAKVEWAVHMPARGTLYALMDGVPDDSGTRFGRMRAGSREFATRAGSVYEQYDATRGEYEDSDGKLVLTTILVSTELPEAFDEESVAEVSE